MNAVLHEHAGKLGFAGSLAVLKLSDASTLAALLLALVSTAAVLPVAIRRWRALIRRRE